MIWNSFITVVLISTRQRDCFLLPESLTLWAPRHSLTLPSPLPVAGHHSQHFPTGPNHSFFMVFTVFTLEISPRQTRCTWTPCGSCHCTEITLVLSVAVGYVRCVLFEYLEHQRWLLRLITMEGIELIVSLQQVQNHQENLLISSDGQYGFSAVSVWSIVPVWKPSSVCIRVGQLESPLSS